MKTTTQLVEGITPLPWKLSLFFTPDQDDDPLGVYVVNEARDKLTPLYDSTAGEDELIEKVHAENRANAEYVERAVNSLPKLVEALQVIAGMEFDFDHSAQHREEALKIVARAVLEEVLGKAQP